jgi:hypothetical protein
LCDDAVFVLRDNKVFLYYKGLSKKLTEGGKPVRNVTISKDKGRRGTFLMGSVAGHPEKRFVKLSKGPLHRGHEAALWRQADGSVGSFGIGWGELLYYRAEDGENFEPINALASKIMAAGLYREDFDTDIKGARPVWGMKMSNFGLQRFEIVWP